MSAGGNSVLAVQLPQSLGDNPHVDHPFARTFFDLEPISESLLHSSLLTERRFQARYGPTSVGALSAPVIRRQSKFYRLFNLAGQRHHPGLC